MDALHLFLLEHARAHSAAVAADTPLALEDAVLDGLGDDQIRLRLPAGGNSLAWLLWHMARIEDVAVNLVLAGRPQVLDEAQWLPRLGVTRRDVGSGMQEPEVADFSARVDIGALRAYRAAVGRRTRAVVAGMEARDLTVPIAVADVHRAVAAGAFGEHAGWLASFWQGKPKGWYLSWTGTGHNYLHLGEAMALRGQAGFSLGR
jgi:hypothetical protein